MLILALLIFSTIHAQRDIFRLGHVGENIHAIGHFLEHEMNADFMKTLIARAERPVGQTPEFEYSPVIFIPGMTGAVIEAKLEDKDRSENPLIICSTNSDWYILYAGTDITSLDAEVLAIMMPGTYKCTFDNLKMAYTTSTGRLVPRSGVETRVKGQTVQTTEFNDDDPLAGIGSPDADLHFGQGGFGMEYILQSVGYTSGVNLWHAPYDFRKSSVDYVEVEYVQLKELTEHVYKTNNNQKIAYIGISMGGPYLSSFMLWSTEEWKEKYVENIITFAGVFGGASYNLGTLIYGETYGIPFIDAHVFQQMYKTWGCSTWLTPMEGYEHNRVVVEVTELDDSITEYRVDELKDFFKSVPDLQQSYEMKRDFLNEDHIVHQPYHDPGVKTHCMFNANTPTIQTYKLDRADIQKFDAEKNAESADTGDYTGDGVANYLELAVCRDWEDARIWESENFPHGAGSGDPEHMRYVLSILKGKGTNTVDCKETHVKRSTCAKEDNVTCVGEGWVLVGDPEVCATPNDWGCKFRGDCEKYHQWCVKEDWWVCGEGQKCGATKEECAPITTPVDDNGQTNYEVKTSGDSAEGDLVMSSGECEKYAELKGLPFEFRTKDSLPTGCVETQIDWDLETMDIVLFQRAETQTKCSAEKKCVSWKPVAAVFTESEIAEPKSDTLSELEVADTYRHNPRDTFHYGSVSNNILAAGYFHEHEMFNPNLMKEIMAKGERPVGTAGFDWTPLIFIPGMTGTVIEANLEDKSDNPLIICAEDSDWYVLYAGTDIPSLDWSVLAIMAPQTYKCTFDNLKLQYQVATGLLWPKDGILTRVKGEHVERSDFDENDPTKVIGSFDSDDPTASIGDFDADLHWGQPGGALKSALLAYGYTEYLDMWHAPYDFRKGPLDFNEKEWPRLKQLVEHVYTLNGNRKVAFVGISMGGPYLSSFMLWSTDAWKTQYVESIITVAGVFGGAISNLGTMMYGETYGIPYIDPKLFQEMYVTWGCGSWLTSMEGNFDDRVLVKVNEADGSVTEYNPTEIDDLFERLGLDYAADMKKNYYSPSGDKAERYARAFLDPGVKTHCMFNRNAPTLGTIEVNADTITLYDPDQNAANTVSTGGYTGDGVSSYEELAVCRDWEDAHIWEYVDHPHGWELGSSKHLNYIGSILKGKGQSAVACNVPVVTTTDCSGSPSCPEGTYAGDKEDCEGGAPWYCLTCGQRKCYSEMMWLCDPNKKCGTTQDSCLPIQTPTQSNTETKLIGLPCPGDVGLSIAECENYATVVGKEFELRMDKDNVAGCSETQVTWRGSTTTKVLFNKPKDVPSTESCSVSKKCVCFKQTSSSEAEIEVATVQTPAQTQNFEVYLGIFAVGALLGAWQFTKTKQVEQVPLLDDEI